VKPKRLRLGCIEQSKPPSVHPPGDQNSWLAACRPDRSSTSRAATVTSAMFASAVSQMMLGGSSLPLWNVNALPARQVVGCGEEPHSLKCRRFIATSRLPSGVPHCGQT
jgi:hypothetical protein